MVELPHGNCARNEPFRGDERKRAGMVGRLFGRGACGPSFKIDQQPIKIGTNAKGRANEMSRNVSLPRRSRRRRSPNNGLGQASGREHDRYWRTPSGVILINRRVPGLLGVHADHLADGGSGFERKAAGR